MSRQRLDESPKCKRSLRRSWGGAPRGQRNSMKGLPQRKRENSDYKQSRKCHLMVLDGNTWNVLCKSEELELFCFRHTCFELQEIQIIHMMICIVQVFIILNYICQVLAGGKNRDILNYRRWLRFMERTLAQKGGTESWISGPNRDILESWNDGSLFKNCSTSRKPRVTLSILSSYQRHESLCSTLNHPAEH